MQTYLSYSFEGFLWGDLRFAWALSNGQAGPEKQGPCRGRFENHGQAMVEMGKHEENDDEHDMNMMFFFFYGYQDCSNPV